jgi:hypothetical protein
MMGRLRLRSSPGNFDVARSRLTDPRSDGVASTLLVN